MAKRSSRKSSSGDEALLWGIAAVVVAVAGVGAAIMLTRGKSACADVKCSTNQVKTGKTTWKTDKSECCKPNPGLTCGTAADGNPYPYSCGDYGTLKNNPTQIKCDTVCTKDICCDKPAGSKKQKNPKPPAPTCTVQGGNGTCMSKTNTQGKRNCVGADQLCGVNLAAHTRAHPKAKDENTCEDIFDKYHKNMIKCNDKYKAYVKKDEQGNCLFKCDKAMCCATPTGMNTYSDDNDPTNPPENKCRMSGPGETSCGELDPNCKWTIPTKKQMTKVGCIVGEKPTPPVNKKTAKPTGKCCGSSSVCSVTEKGQCNPESTGYACNWSDTGECKKENFRMRRWRR